MTYYLGTAAQYSLSGSEEIGELLCPRLNDG